MAAFQQPLLASAAQTGSSNSVPLPVATATMLAVQVDITAGSGTPTLTLWMEGSNDDGTTWFRLVANAIVTDINGTIADVANRSNIVNASASTTVDRYGAVYNYLPCKLVRSRWTLTGGTPSRTFSINVSGK